MSIVLTGNLTIENGGNLTLKNMTLILNCTFDGEFHIEVLDGGIMNILDLDMDHLTDFDTSKITSIDTKYEYNFWVRDGSRFEMKNSNLSECGYFWFGDTLKQGLLIETDTAIIDHCFFSKCHSS